MSRDANLYPLRQTHLDPHDDAVWNWAQNAQIGTRQQVKRPADEAALQQLLRESSGKVRVIGKTYSLAECCPCTRTSCCWISVR